MGKGLAAATAAPAAASTASLSAQWLAGAAKAALAGRLLPSRRAGLPDPAAAAAGAQHRRRAPYIELES